MYDDIQYRAYGQDIAETLVQYIDVSVWNALTTKFHPIQLLVDLLIMQEQ